MPEPHDADELDEFIGSAPTGGNADVFRGCEPTGCDIIPCGPWDEEELFGSPAPPSDDGADINLRGEDHWSPAAGAAADSSTPLETEVRTCSSTPSALVISTSASSSAGCEPIQNEWRRQMIAMALSKGGWDGESIARFIKSQMKGTWRKEYGRNTDLYVEMAWQMRMEKEVAAAARRALIEEQRDKELTVHASKRMAANMAVEAAEKNER